LTVDEAKPFVKDLLAALGSPDNYTEEYFMEVFTAFDKDGSGKIQKSEMFEFNNLMGNLSKHIKNNDVQ